MNGLSPFVLMRGGTSKGAYFLASQLPSDRAGRDAVLLRLMRSESLRRDYALGVDSVSSKVAIVGPSSRPDADVDYLFAQVDAVRGTVDTNLTCGNILAGVAPFAIDSGLVPAEKTAVRVHSVNTGALVRAVVEESSGRESMVKLTFSNIAGAKTGKVLPTGRVRDDFDGVPATCVDVGVPLVVAEAASLGMTGREAPRELDANAAFMARLESLRREAGGRMGLGDVSRLVMPKICMISPAHEGSSISSRYFTPFACHPSFAVTGAMALSAACRIPGTLAAGLAKTAVAAEEPVVIEHPSGRIAVRIEMSVEEGRAAVSSATILRTAGRLSRERLWA